LLKICKMVDRRMWATQSPLRQFSKDIPDEVIKKIERKDFPLERMYDLSAQEIGDLVAFPAMGKTLFRLVHQFPKLELTAYVQPVTRSTLKVQLTITPDFEYDVRQHEQALPFWILVEDVDGERVLHYEYFLLKHKYADEEHYVDFMIPLLEPTPPHYYIRLVSDRWLGAETVIAVPFTKLLLPERFPPPTELLDLQPLLVSDLRPAKYQRFYAFRTFNPIQTQVYPSLANGDQNVLVCAPTNSGKTACAEFALFRLFGAKAQGAAAKALYVGPTAALCVERYHDWKRKFEALDNNHVSLALLTGDVAQDLRLLERAALVIATPEQWDVLSRRWKQRKFVQAVELFITDELHLVGGEQGATLEVVVSRMRYLFSHLKRGRIVALASSVANARDLGDWIGATAQTTFNFHPNTRPISLEVHIQGFDQPNQEIQQLSMVRPTLYAVAQHARTRPTIVFVPTKKLCRSVTRDFVAFADPEDRDRTFLHCPRAAIERHLEHVQNKLLREAMTHGVAFYHDGLSADERKIVEALFREGALQVLIADQSTAWGMTLQAYQVVIMGAKTYNGKQHRYVDYPIADLLQMIGRAGRHGVDDNAKCFLFCFGPRKEFYKRFLLEPIPVESHLDHALADHVNAEIVTKTIESVQDAVDWITWSLLYRRLIQNPAYYRLSGVTQRHLSDHLSELVETTLQELQKAKCVSVEGEDLVAPLNLGMIACYYNVNYATIDMFNNSLNGSTKIKVSEIREKGRKKKEEQYKYFTNNYKLITLFSTMLPQGILEVLSNAVEFEILPIRHGEANVLSALAAHERLKVPSTNFTTVPAKVHVLLQAHFTRTPLPGDLLKDQEFVVEQAVRLLQAMVDVVSSNGWLQPALSAMELSQMIVQAVWDNDSLLRQLPHFSRERVERCEQADVKDIFALLELEDDQRTRLLQMTGREMADVARVCNRYPNVELSLELQNGDTVQASKPVRVAVSLERDFEGELGNVSAPFFP
jgi:pre-mRNA-splicing helicase BRR2